MSALERSRDMLEGLALIFEESAHEYHLARSETEYELYFSTLASELRKLSEDAVEIVEREMERRYEAAQERAMGDVSGADALVRLAQDARRMK